MQRNNRREDATELKSGTALTVELTLKPPRRRQEKAALPSPKPTPTTSEGRIPHISRLMALAIKFQDLIHRGVIPDYADLARLGYVTRARVTQIMNLGNLAPEIQEELLFLPPAKGRGPITERHLRSLDSVIDWTTQRRLWSELRRARRPDIPPGSPRSDASATPDAAQDRRSASTLPVTRQTTGSPCSPRI
jgi:hypothetical protein